MKKYWSTKYIQFLLCNIFFIIVFVYPKNILAQNTNQAFNVRDNSAEYNTPQDEPLKGDVKLLSVPEKFKSHPEYSKTKLSNPDRQNSYELIQERTIDSRLFQNRDGSFTAVKSAEPMHYKDTDGWWRTIDVTFEKDPVQNQVYHLNKQKLPMSFDGKTGVITMYLDDQNSMTFGNELSLLQSDNNGNIISEKGINNISAGVNLNKADISNIFNGIDMSLVFDFWMAKTNYIISSTADIDNNAQWVVFREKVNIPANWTFDYDLNTGSFINENWQGDLVVRNTNGEIKSKFLKPIYFDSGTDRNTNNITGSYKIEKIDNSTYYLYLMVPVTWLLSPDRVYPVNIDPFSIIDDPTICQSCFYPNFQASNLSVIVPVGCSVINSNFLWEFTAVNNVAWMEDQRSYVSSDSGSTSVFYGSGQTYGTQTYTTFSTIGNSTSTGAINYTFYASRVYGGTACDNNYNYIKRRRVEVEYYCSVSLKDSETDLEISSFFDHENKNIVLKNTSNLKNIYIYDILGKDVPFTITSNQNNSEHFVKLNVNNPKIIFLKIVAENKFLIKKLFIY